MVVQVSYVYRAVVVSVHDGDTIRADVDLGFFMHAIVSLRFLGINAPELNAAGGAASRDYLASLIPPGTAILASTVITDKFGGRFDAEIVRAADNLNVNEDMVTSGHAVVYP